MPRLFEPSQCSPRVMIHSFHTRRPLQNGRGSNVEEQLMREHHDREWGVPTHDDRRHFEFLILETAQAGLSWSIVLKKREG